MAVAFCCPVRQPPDRDAHGLPARRWSSTRGKDLWRSPSIDVVCSLSARPSSAGLAVLFGLFGSGQWLEWLLFRYAQPFGDVDPVLGRDVSFYVFRLPFLDLLSGYLLALVLLAGATAGAVYVLAGAIGLDLNRGPRIAGQARRHLAALAAALLLVMAFDA